MRMHSSSPATQIPLPVSVILPHPLQNGGAEQTSSALPQLVDRYCQDCDIRFYSVKTLKAHKMHYCSSRYTKGSPASKNSSTPASPTDSQRLSPEPLPQSRPCRPSERPFLLLRTDPVLIVPYSLLQSASVFTGTSPSLPSQDAPCILMPNGTVQPMSHLVSRLSDEKDIPKNMHNLTKQNSKTLEESLPARNARSKLDSIPLDLSVRRSSESSDLIIDMEDEKENVFASPRREDTIYSPILTSSHGNIVPLEKRSEERKSSEPYSSSSSPNLPSSPGSKKSPRRTPNGIGSLRVDGGKTRDSKKGNEAECRNSFEAEAPARQSSLTASLSDSLPLMPSQLPLLLPGAPAELLTQPSLLPLLSSDLRIPGVVSAQTVPESSVPQVSKRVRSF